jgi:hypothetical protein
MLETRSMAMSQNPEDKRGSVDQNLDSPEKPKRRNLFILKASADLGVAAFGLGASKGRRRQLWTGGDVGFGHQDTTPKGGADGTETRRR